MGNVTFCKLIIYKQYDQKITNLKSMPMNTQAEIEALKAENQQLRMLYQAARDLAETREWNYQFLVEHPDIVLGLNTKKMEELSNKNLLRIAR